MNKNLKLPKGYANTIRKKLGNKYSVSLIQKVRVGSRDNLEIKKALLVLSSEHNNEIKNIMELEERITHS